MVLDRRASFLLGQELGFFEVTGPDRGLFAVVFAILAAAFAPAGAVHNSSLPITLIGVSIGLACQAVAAFARSEPFVLAGSIILIIAALLAAYMLIEKFYGLTLGRRVVPLGRPWVVGNLDHES